MPQSHATVQRRTSLPQALEDPEDLTVGQEEAEYYEIEQRKKLAMGPAALLTDQILPKEGFAALPRELRNLLAGGIAGMVAKTFVAPFDRIKILYQVSNAKFHLRNIPSVVGNIIRNEGLSALWKGNLATMIRIFPYSGIQFMVFDRIKRYYLGNHKQNLTDSDKEVQKEAQNRKFGLTATESLIGGMIAGSISVLCTYPLDLSRAQLAVLKKYKHSANMGLYGILKVNYQRNGVAGLFRGITPTIVGILPYSGIAFTLNEQAKREIQNITGRDVTTIERLQCGALSGLFAQSITYPVEVTRRRMQTIGLVGPDTAISQLGQSTSVSRGASTAASAVEIPLDMFGIIRNLYAEQGISGFFKGVSVNWIKGPLSFSISFTTFDTVQSLMETEMERAQRRYPKRTS